MRNESGPTGATSRAVVEDVHSLIEIARAQERRGELSEALGHYTEALTKLSDEPDSSLRADVVRWMGAAGAGCSATPVSQPTPGTLPIRPGTPQLRSGKRSL